jgi:hypothetical protein
MKNNKKAQSPAVEKIADNVRYKFALFPRPICLEKCTMKIPKGYEEHILMTLKAFSNKEAYYRKTPHKLEGKDDLYSIDVKSRDDKYRMFFYIEDRVCKITNLCSTDTH